MSDPIGADPGDDSSPHSSSRSERVTELATELVAIAKAHDAAPDLWSGPIDHNLPDLHPLKIELSKSLDVGKLLAAAGKSVSRRASTRKAGERELSDALRDLELEELLVAFIYCARDAKEEDRDPAWAKLLLKSLEGIYGVISSHYGETVRSAFEHTSISGVSTVKDICPKISAARIGVATVVFATTGTRMLWQSLVIQNAGQSCIELLEESDDFTRIILHEGDEDVILTHFEDRFRDYAARFPPYSYIDESRSLVPVPERLDCSFQILEIKRLYQDRTVHYKVSFKAWIWVYMTLDAIVSDLVSDVELERYQAGPVSANVETAFKCIARCLQHPLSVEAYGWPIFWALSFSLAALELPQMILHRVLFVWITRLWHVGADVADFHISTLIYGVAGRGTLGSAITGLFSALTINFTLDAIAHLMVGSDAEAMNFAHCLQFHLSTAAENHVLENPALIYFLGHAINIHGLRFLAYGGTISTKLTNIWFPFLHARLWRHRSSETYSDYDDIVRLIRKRHGLSEGSARRYYAILDGSKGGCDSQDCKNVGNISDMKLCSRCKVALYCDAECQKKAWKEHRRHCVPWEEKTSA